MKNHLGNKKMVAKGLPDTRFFKSWPRYPLKTTSGRENLTSIWAIKMSRLEEAGIVYLEPQWPLFWLEFGPCFGRLTLKNRGQLGSRYIYITYVSQLHWTCAQHLGVNRASLYRSYFISCPKEEAQDGGWAFFDSHSKWQGPKNSFLHCAFSGMFFSVICVMAI